MGKHSGRARLPEEAEGAGLRLGRQRSSTTPSSASRTWPTRRRHLRRGSRRAGRRRGRARQRPHPLVSLYVHAGSKTRPTASSSSRWTACGGRHGRPATARSTRPSRRIRQIFPHEVHLKLYSGPCGHRGYRRPGRGDGAAGGGRQAGHGQGADTDTLVASARAYVHALNQLLVNRARERPGGTVRLTPAARHAWPGGRAPRLGAAGPSRA